MNIDQFAFDNGYYYADGVYRSYRSNKKISYNKMRLWYLASGH